MFRTIIVTPVIYLRSPVSLLNDSSLFSREILTHYTLGRSMWVCVLLTACRTKVLPQASIDDYERKTREEE